MVINGENLAKKVLRNLIKRSRCDVISKEWYKPVIIFSFEKYVDTLFPITFKNQAMLSTKLKGVFLSIFW